jgi:hypothetical protein
MNCKDTVYYLRARLPSLKLLTDFHMHLSDDPKWITQCGFVFPPGVAVERPSCGIDFDTLVPMGMTE